MNIYHHKAHRLSRSVAMATAVLTLAMTAFASLAQARSTGLGLTEACAWMCEDSQSLQSCSREAFAGMCMNTFVFPPGPGDSGPFTLDTCPYITLLDSNGQAIGSIPCDVPHTPPFMPPGFLPPDDRWPPVRPPAVGPSLPDEPVAPPPLA